MDLAALLSEVENLSTLDDTALADLLSRLRAAADELLDKANENASDEVLADLQKVTAAVKAVKAQQATLKDAADKRKAEIDALAAELAEGDEDEEGDDDGGEPAAPPEPETTEEEAEDKVPVAAAAKPAPPRVGKVAARRPELTKPAPKPAQQVSLVAASSADGIHVGEDVTGDPEKIARLFIAQLQASQGYRGPEVRVPVVRMRGEFPEERRLDGDMRRNQEKISAVTSLEALTASGGICAPTEVRYDLPVLPASNARPVRDALARFGADRGGIRTLPPPIIDDLAGAVTVWTEANDTTPSSPTTKPCLTVTCPSPDETVVDAIVRCLKFGNFNARFFPEQIDTWMTLAAAQWAREAEVKHLTAIGTGSTQVTTGTDIMGATRDVLARLALAATALRNRHRLDPDYPLRVMFPAWLLDMIRVDQARGITVGTLDETLALADAAILRWIQSHRLNVSTFLDGETGQTFGAQGDGLLNPWPDSVITYMFPEGSWLFLDGGQLDLGLVRDSTLNGTNDFQMFAESFENVHFHGVESLRITIDVCPDGTMSGTKSVTLCSSGS